MAVVKVGLIVIIVSHLAALIVTISRLVNRIWRNAFSLDDAFATVTGLGTSLNVGALVEIVLNVPDPMTLGHRLIIGGCFFVVWASKAQSVMTLGRVLYASYWPQHEPLFFLLSLCLFIIGAAHLGITLFFCNVDANCSDNTPCYCNVAPKLILSALIANSVIDAAIVGLSVHIYTLDWLRAHFARKWIVKPAIISNVAIFVVDVGIWVSYKNVTSGRYTLLFIMANAAAVLSAVLSNIATIVGIAKISSTGVVHNFSDDNDNNHRQVDIPLGLLTAISDNSDPNNSVAVVILEKTAGSNVWESAKIAATED